MGGPTIGFWKSRSLSLMEPIAAKPCPCVLTGRSCEHHGERFGEPELQRELSGCASLYSQLPHDTSQTC